MRCCNRRSSDQLLQISLIGNRERETEREREREDGGVNASPKTISSVGCDIVEDALGLMRFRSRKFGCWATCRVHGKPTGTSTKIPTVRQAPNSIPRTLMCMLVWYVYSRRPDISAFTN